jgi:uncharacterized SAM-binding protein YcdF (DUF218 family)
MVTANYDPDVTDHRWRRHRTTAAIVLLIAVFFGASLSAWPRSDPMPEFGADLVIALNSGLLRDSILDFPAAGRLRTAMDIARRLGVRRLVTTRVVDPETGVSTDAGQRAVVAAGHYVGGWTVLRPVVRSTHDEALALRDYVQGNRRIIVVTSRLHSRRACATFEGVGFSVTCVVGYTDPRWWRTPFAFLRELAAMANYRWNGWLH